MILRFRFVGISAAILTLLTVGVTHSQFLAWRKVFDGQGLSVGINPLNPQTIYAQGNDNRLYVSHDRGGTWSSLPPSLPSQIREILVHPNDTLTIFAADFFQGLRKSTDGGQSWTVVISSYGIDGESISCDPVHPDTMYAGNFGNAAVYRSSDRGSTWTLQGHAGSGILCGLIVRPDSETVLYAGTGSGTISKSSDAGVTWHLVKSGGSDEIPKFAVNPSNPLIGFATGYEGTTSAEGVWETTDGGENWFLTPLQELSVWSLDIDHRHPDTIYAGTFSEPNAGVYKTTDGGSSWTLLSRGFIPVNAMWNLKLDQASDTSLYVGVTDGDFGADGVYRLDNADAGIQGTVRDSLTGSPIATGTLQLNPSGASVSLDLSGGNYGFYRFAGDTSTAQSFTVTINSIPFEQGTVSLTTDSIRQQDLLVQPASISGRVFDDVNRNGVEDTGEPALGSRTVLLRGQTTASVFTDSTGRFEFDDLFPGADTVAAQPIFGWRLTSAAPSYSATIDLTRKSIGGNDFGFHRNIAVAAVSPLPYSVANPVTGSVQLTFDTAMNAGDFNDTASFLVNGSVSGRHRGSFLFSGGNAAVRFDPAKPFSAGEDATVELTGRLRTAGGDSITPFVFHFQCRARSSPGTFAPKVDYTVGSNPWSVTAGDLNGDGYPDIVTANSNSNSVSVLINRGDGTFAPRSDYPVGAGPRCVILADVDGDGMEDIVTANNGGSSVSVLRNNGDGTFAPRADYPAGSSPIAVAAVDLDGDGRPDLVVTDFGSGHITILANGGTGVFSTTGFLPAGISPWPAAAADINGDGSDDVIVGNSASPSSLETFLNLGGGSVASSTSYPAGGFVRALAVADVDGDGYPDLLATNSATNSLTLYRGSSDGAFGARTDLPAGSLPWGLAVGDLDGDGRPDLLVTSAGTDSVSVLKNLGGGLFARTDYPAGPTPRGVAVADLERDGDLDIIVANSGLNTISVLQNATTVASVVDSGWNLISLPVRTLATSRSALYPSATSSAFAFNGGYVPTDSITSGGGFWLKFGAAGAAALYGDSLLNDTVALNARWNLVGSLSTPIAAGSITTIPGGILSGAIFGYQGSYVPADTLRPGSGYWVKSSQPGFLVMTSLSGRSLPKFASGGIQLSGMSTLTIRDAEGRSQKLYFSLADSAGESDRFEMPPPGPVGTFDARYASNSIAEIVAPGKTGEFPISIASARYPVTVEWKMAPVHPAVSLLVGNTVIHMSGSGSSMVRSARDAVRLQLSGSPELPQTFSLEQNYPNPFNPTTTIRYALPVDARVRLTVYDALGRELVLLVDGFRPAGVESVSWNASSLASGVYFVRLDAVPAAGAGKAFVEVKKTLLMK